jgi:hypothetical protein
MNEDFRELLAGYVDGELSEEQRQAFEAELARNPELQSELKEFRRLKEVTGMARYADLPDEVWETYWQSLYRKLERGVGWILLSVGAVILLGFGLYELFRGLYANPEAPLWLKVGLSALAAGGVFLLVSYARERLFAYNRDRYKEVMR